MEKINFHLTAVILVLAALFIMSGPFATETFVFFGFAENKEMEIRVEHDVEVRKIYVTPGNEVKKGTVLLELDRSDLEMTHSTINHNIANVESQLILWETALRGSIAQLEAQKIEKQNKIQSEMDQLESELALNQSIIKDFNSLPNTETTYENSPVLLRKQGLQKELELSVKPIDEELKALKAELLAPQNPLKIQISKLKDQLDFTYKEEEKLFLRAPIDGVVGAVFCKVGEQIPAFSTLMSFYEQTPTQVKGFVLESLILNVNMGDTVMVNSAAQFENSCMGEIVGMGSRIVEIPSRLQKNPTIKTYGREIIIAIPADNYFLQKEKVILNKTTEDNYSEGFLSVLNLF